MEYVLQELNDEEHCAYPRAALAEKTHKVLKISPEIIDAGVAHGLVEGRLVEGNDARGQTLIYLAGHEMAAQATQVARMREIALGRARACGAPISRWSGARNRGGSF